jgi:hypothetical protein
MGDGEPVFLVDKKLNSILVFDLNREILFSIPKNNLAEVKTIPLAGITRVENPITNVEEYYAVPFSCMSEYVLYFKNGDLVMYYKKEVEY